MLTLLWLKGLVGRRAGRLLGAVAGVMLTVALLTSLGSFIASSAASMTQHAIAGVPVDWQIQLAPGSDLSAAVAALGRSTSYSALESVGYADVGGFSASSNGTVQTTGAGKVLGIGAQYQQHFPAEIRPLIGSADGVLVTQQTAANLHVAAGDSVTIQRLDLPPVMVAIDGVVDLPNADSLFQAVGVPAGTAPQAPPDNVLLLPVEQWHQLFDAQAAARPDSVRTQLHVRITHQLPSDPGTAFLYVQRLAHNLEARIAGSGVVGDNLSARLEGARADALYARVLFLFLGLPGAILAMLLTLAVAASGADRRRQEQALLRIRGASTARILCLESMEALIVGSGGMVLGIALGVIAARAVGLGAGTAGAGTVLWTASAAVIGLLLATMAIFYPAWMQTRYTTVAAARVAVGRGRKPLWQRMYVDVFVLAASAVAFWQTASTGYQIVLAPEGVPQASVAYQAFIGPVCFWLGVGLLSMHLWEGGLARGRCVLAFVLSPVAHGLRSVVAASLARQRALVTRGVVLVALALAFATSTAVFNTTYNRQSLVDAQLTNGADVTITGSTAFAPGSKLVELKALPGVAAIQPMQHRFAYVGNDLQDIYGIDPLHIGSATAMSNAFFVGGDARTTLAALGSRTDGLLVSQETVTDYQLKPGDQVNLRLQSAQDQQYHVVPFHFVGVVREFPTAPKDSFLVANASYIAEQTGAEAAEIVLMRVNGRAVDVAAQAWVVVGSLAGAKVADIGSTQRTISSSLTAVDLRGLTRLELAFAVLLVAGATGLVLALGLVERRRTFAILTALGATDVQRGAFLWSEGLLILFGGTAIGVTTGFSVAQILVKLLSGVFDPPPGSLSVPWTYLTLLLVAATASTLIAVVGMQIASRRPAVEVLRDM